LPWLLATTRAKPQNIPKGPRKVHPSKPARGRTKKSAIPRATHTKKKGYRRKKESSSKKRKYGVKGETRTHVGLGSAGVSKRRGN